MFQCVNYLRKDGARFMRYDVLPAQAMVTEASITLMKCIDLFESGAENIYLIEGDGRYRWRAALRDDTRLNELGAGKWTLSMKPLAPIVIDDLHELHNKQLFEISEYFLAKYPHARELPIVHGGGAIVSLLRKKRTNQGSGYDWRQFRNFTGCMESNRYYIASEANSDLREFAEAFTGKFDVQVLSEDNVQEVLSGREDACLLYSVDIYPNIRKQDIKQVYERLIRQKRYQYLDNCCNAHKDKVRQIANETLISDEWACMNIGQADDLSQAIGLFDEGFQSIYLCDDDGSYRGTMRLYDFTVPFRKQQKPLPYVDSSIPYTGHEWEDKLHFGAALLECEEVSRPAQEEALVKEGKIMASALQNFGVVGPKGYGRYALFKKQTFHWQLISDSVADAFIRENSRLMLSSERGPMRGFRERFGKKYDITVYDGTNFTDYVDGKVDMLIYGEKFWQDNGVTLYACRQMYVDMLCLELYKYFTQSGIAYYYVDRLTNLDLEPQKSPPAAWSGLSEDYIVPIDYIGDEYFNVVNGHRQDSPLLEDFERTVYVYGVCIATGIYAPFGKTIEAFLQEKLIEKGKKWRVVNCGGMGSHDIVFNDINQLHIMMHTHFHRGDIIVHFGESCWQNNNLREHPPIIRNADVFEQDKYRNGCYWKDCFPPHCNQTGYKIWAEYLLTRIMADEQKLQIVNREQKETLFPFAVRLGQKRVVNKMLKEYLRSLANYKRYNNGAIVMNANPFTLGHLHLVETARKLCGILYIFVVQEDKSEITFKDRFAIVKENCAGMDNVEVLPSGQYIISTLTFPEYFEKDERQEQIIMPSHDIKLFGEAIAPALGITKRFVGEEPFDKVTRQYNESMKNILPDYGVKLIEIKRKEASDGHAINATQVRRWMKNGELDKCKAFLPKYTLDYLREHGLTK